MGDKWMRLAFTLRVRPRRQGDDWPPSRAELLSDLVALLQRRTLPTRHGTLRFLEHRLSSIASMTQAAGEGDDLFVPYGLMFAKKWLWEQGGRPLPRRLDTSSRDSDLSGCLPKDACPGRHWAWSGHALRLSPANVGVFVPDAIAKAALMAFGIGTWKIEALEDYAEPASRPRLCADTMRDATQTPVDR